MIFCNEPRKSEEEKGYLKKICRGMRNPATYSTPLYMNYYYEIISLALSFTLRASPFFLGRVALAASSDVTAPLSQTNQQVSNMAFVSMVVFLWCVLHSRYAQHRVVWGWGGGGLKKCFGHCNCSKFVMEGILHVEFEVGTWEIIFDSVHLSLVINGPTR